MPAVVIDYGCCRQPFLCTSATDLAPIKHFRLGERWELFGDVISSEIGE
jgi:hypothetical protein